GGAPEAPPDGRLPDARDDDVVLELLCHVTAGVTWPRACPPCRASCPRRGPSGCSPAASRPCARPPRGSHRQAPSYSSVYAASSLLKNSIVVQPSGPAVCGP